MGILETIGLRKKGKTISELKDEATRKWASKLRKERETREMHEEADYLEAKARKIGAEKEVEVYEPRKPSMMENIRRAVQTAPPPQSQMEEQRLRPQQSMFGGGQSMFSGGSAFGSSLGIRTPSKPLRMTELPSMFGYEKKKKRK